ncbi:MAG: hypothetical protein ACK4KT_09320 [Thermaurantimonas sp.]
MTKVNLLLVWVIVLVSIGFSCRKFNTFDPIPYIEYKSHDFRRAEPLLLNMLLLEMVFRDGDGDIGLDEGDTLPPFDKASPFFHNLWIDLYTIRNGQPQDTFTYNARIPNITPSGQVKSLEGVISYEIPVDGLSEGDTIRLGIQLVDRALNISPRAFSPDIVVRPPQ